MEVNPSSKFTATHKSPLHTSNLLRRTAINRAFLAVYSCAILALLYHHAYSILHSTTLVSSCISVCLFVSDLLFSFMWFTTQSYRVRPIHRHELMQTLKEVAEESEFPSLDVFICTADPYKEPPVTVVNTALSVMAYDYPTDKISVYVSDDGGSQLTLFAFMEAAKFASHWLPFCRKNNVTERSPQAYFGSNHHILCPEAKNIKVMYESMKVRVENVVERGQVSLDQISEQERKNFDEWTEKFTRRDHPTVIKVLLDSTIEKDTTGHLMPNLIYVSRQKSTKSPHHFKAGALNVLLRVSATMTNAPIILTLDCDMYSNDPLTAKRVLCYFLDPLIKSRLGFIQFPQRFHGINKNDTYACEHKRLFQINPLGMDGLAGPGFVGTNCFFSRRAFFGGPATLVSPEIPELGPNFSVDKPIGSHSVLSLAQHVAACNYENDTKWGSQFGFRYGSLVEDFYTGFRLLCEGWRSIFCNPDKAAFLGDIPTTLNDMLSQNKRWAVGLLEVAFSKYSTITFGVKSMGLLMGLCFSHTAFWPIWSIPITIYAILPQLTLLSLIPIFPKVSDAWFLLYAFLFLGAYLQDFADFMLEGGTVGRWWNDQRMWMVRGLTCYMFGFIEFLLKSLGIPTQGFSLTSKVLDDELSKRYDEGVMEFGVHSPMFVSMTTAAILSLVSFSRGLMDVARGKNLEELFGQMFVAGFVVVNSWPIYEAILLRTDKGRMPVKTTLASTCLAWALCIAVSRVIRM